MSLRVSRTSKTNRGLPRKTEYPKDSNSHRAWYDPELQTAASLYIDDFLGRVTTGAGFHPDHPNRARHHHLHRSPKYCPPSAVPSQTVTKGPPRWTNRFPGDGGNMDLVHEEHSRYGGAISTKAKMEPLRIGLRHLAQQYQETQAVCNQLKTEFDDQVRRVKAYCGSSTLDKLWRDKSRSKRDSRQSLDAKLCTVEYCLDSLDTYLLRVAVPAQADEQMVRIRESGRGILRLMSEARRSRASLHRLVAELNQAEVEANPNSEENKAIFDGQDEAGSGHEQNLSQDNDADGAGGADGGGDAQLLG